MNVGHPRPLILYFCTSTYAHGLDTHTIKSIRSFYSPIVFLTPAYQAVSAVPTRCPICRLNRDFSPAQIPPKIKGGVLSAVRGMKPTGRCHSSSLVCHSVVQFSVNEHSASYQSYLGSYAFYSRYASAFPKYHANISGRAPQATKARTASGVKKPNYLYQDREIIILADTLAHNGVLLQ